MCRLLHRLGLSAQRPLWRAYQQNPEAVKHWLATEYPTIQRRARREGATIFFADETGVRSDFHSGTTWGLRGRTPVVSSTGARFGVNLISAVSAQGQLRFHADEGPGHRRGKKDFLGGCWSMRARRLCGCRWASDAWVKSVARFVAAQARKLALIPAATLFA